MCWSLYRNNSKKMKQKACLCVWQSRKICGRTCLQETKRSNPPSCMDFFNYELKQNSYANIPSQVFRGKILIWQKVNLAVGQSVIVRCVRRDNYKWRKTRWEKSGGREGFYGFRLLNKLDTRMRGWLCGWIVSAFDLLITGANTRGGKKKGYLYKLISESFLELLYVSF